MASLIGVTLALAVGGFARWLGLDRNRSFYATIVIVVASYYVLFAVVAGSAALLTEGSVCIGFAVLASIGFKKSPWVIVTALIAHGMFDLVHPHAVKNSGVPVWWPEFCLAYDVAAGAFLALLLIRERHSRSQRSGGDTRAGPPLGLDSHRSRTADGKHALRHV